MTSSNDCIFKPPQRVTRSRAYLFKNAEIKPINKTVFKTSSRRHITLKSKSKPENGEFEKNSFKTALSVSDMSKILEKQSLEQFVGVLTRNRCRTLLQKGFEPIFKSKKVLRDVCTDSGYGTSSDTSKDCAESITSESRESLESGLSEPYKNEEINSLPNESTILKKLPLSMGLVSIMSNFNEKDIKKNKMKRTNPENGKYSTPKINFLVEKDVLALVPNENLSNYKGPFELKIEDHKITSSFRETLGCSMRIHHVSPVVSVAPHGINFHEKWPAILIIPLRIKPKDENWLCCFYSGSNPNNPMQWQRLPKKDYFYNNGCLVVITCHFSVFTVVLEEPYPEILKKIRCRTGGRLRIRNVPGIEVNFPKGSLEHDIDACLRVMFDNEPSLDGSSDESEKLLASPIISLGPHGLEFSRSRLPVLISLPIPNYQEIINVCPNAKLIAYESSTDEGEPMVWKKIDVDISLLNFIGYRHGISGSLIPVVTFPVYHFSFFKVMWELLSATLYEAKMGMTYFYPYISFSMMCQAFMEESQENDKFALEVICYRSDRKLSEGTNYRYRVGASLKPKLVRPGRISVRLRSQMFEADIEAGEDSEMIKEESDFRGRDFEKQYACRFKPESRIDKGTFGKVIIERISAKKDLLFEFNLHKAGNVPPPIGCDRWVMFPMKEVAASLKITEGSNWKQLAKVIGFTNSEIENMLGYSPDPFLAMMDIYNSRGGTFEEFVQATYVVSRELIGPASGNESTGSVKSQSSNNSGASCSQDSPMRKLWNMRPWGRLPDSDSADSNQRGSSSTSKEKKRVRPIQNSKGGIAPKRRKFSDASETVQSTSTDEEIEVRKSVPDEKYRNSTRKLRDKDLWRISLGIARRDWRNLGRTLGIEEIVLINLEHSHQSVGFRECAYQMLLEWKSRKPKKCTFGELYSALLREKMVSVAKFMVNKIQHTDEYNDDESDSGKGFFEGTGAKFLRYSILPIMDEETKNLNCECNYNIYMINNLKDRNFKTQNDRQKIVSWIKKLRQCNLTFEDMLLRNEFLHYLLACVKNGELRPPFTEIPPSGPISKLRNLLPDSNHDNSGINTDWVEDLKKADNNIPDIYRKSPDGGEFLSQQPIPKCGAFCYLAIVSKPVNENE